MVGHSKNYKLVVVVAVEHHHGYKSRGAEVWIVDGSKLSAEGNKLSAGGVGNNLSWEPPSPHSSSILSSAAAAPLYSSSKLASGIAADMARMLVPHDNISWYRVELPASELQRTLHN